MPPPVGDRIIPTGSNAMVAPASAGKGQAALVEAREPERNTNVPTRSYYPMSNVLRTTRIACAALGAGLMLTSGTVAAQAGERPKACKGLPTQAQLKTQLVAAVGASNGGLNNNMWATIVNADGIVCAVAFSGSNRKEQWLLSRAISAQKANTANGLSLPAGTPKGNDTEIALSTANLNTAVNPGGSLYGLQHSNPVDAVEAYQGNPNRFGRANDPMVGEKVGGVNVFGGGLGLYNAAKQRVGGVGVSGDTSCADHVIAWRVRDALGRRIPSGGSFFRWFVSGVT
ncbi:MAG: hypothetical protein ACREXJ_02535 [Gammaproteobacteria bacterium]